MTTATSLVPSLSSRTPAYRAASDEPHAASIAMFGPPKLNRFATGANRGIDPAAAPYFRDVVDHLSRMAETIDNLDSLLSSAFNAHIAQIGHVQIADSPTRNEPGTGEINYPFVLRTLDDAGYDGWVSLEYRPRDTTESSLAWLTDMGFWPVA